MGDPFLELTGVHTPGEAISSSSRAALQRNPTYREDIGYAERRLFRREWKSLIEAASRRYYVKSVSDEEHCKVIAEIADELSESHGKVLVNSRLRFGTSQKALNLYLKFLWRLGFVPNPPHCPVDAIVLRAAQLSGSWTKSDCKEQYKGWIDVAEWGATSWLGSP